MMKLRLNIFVEMVQSRKAILALVAVAVLAAVPLVVVWPHSQPAETLANSLEEAINMEIQLGAGEKKVTGSSFNYELQQALQKSLEAAATYYSNNKTQQADYISHELYKVMPVNWDVIIVTGINTSHGILDVIGIQTATIGGSLYAFWLGALPTSKYTAYFVIGRSADLVGASVYLNTGSTDTQKMPQELDRVVRSVNNVSISKSIFDYNKNVATKLYEFNKRIWTILTIHFYYDSQYPQAYARLSALDSARAAYSKEFRYNSTSSTSSSAYVNQIAYYYETYQ